MMRPMRLALLVALVAIVAPEAHGEGGKFPYSLELSPSHPLAGAELQLDLIVRGLSADGMEVTALSVDPALSLESQITEPYVEPNGHRSARLRLVFRALRPGRAEIRQLVLSSREGSLRLGPLAVDILPRPGASGAREEPWVWEAPAEVYRYESFTVSLRPAPEASPGASDRNTGASDRNTAASFAAPAGAALEPAEGLSWTMTALEAGEVRLPEALLSRGGAVVGRAPARAIDVRALPASVEKSRAIGSFELSLEGLEGLRPRAGEPFVVRLILAGRGDLPGLRLPKPLFSLDGAHLGEEYLASRRIDDSQPGRGGYVGRALLELTVTPPAPGRLRISVPSLAVLDPSGVSTALSLPPHILSVSPAALGRTAGVSPFGEAAAVVARLASSSPALARLADLYRLGAAGRGANVAGAAGRGAGTAGRAARARALALLSHASGRDARYLEAALLWEDGDRGRALALLYGEMRRGLGSSAEAAAATACAVELGSGPPILDALPPPRPFAEAGFALLALAAAAAGFVALRRAAVRRMSGLSGPGPRRKTPSYAAVAAFAALAAISLGIAGVSALERRSQYAVVWTDHMLLVPSTLARRQIEIVRGSAAIVRGETAGYVGLRFADGVSGWAPKKYVYYY